MLTALVFHQANPNRNPCLILVSLVYGPHETCASLPQTVSVVVRVNAVHCAKL